MKKISLLLLVFPGLAFANWSAPGLNSFKEQTPGLFVSDATLADMQEYLFGALYIKDDELTKTLGKRWTDWQPGPGQRWHTLTTTSTLAIKLPGRIGGVKTGSAPISATTIAQVLTISPYLSPFCRI